jgi:hypothetical protein
MTANETLDLARIFEDLAFDIDIGAGELVSIDLKNRAAQLRQKHRNENETQLTQLR